MTDHGSGNAAAASTSREKNRFSSSFADLSILAFQLLSIRHASLNGFAGQRFRYSKNELCTAANDYTRSVRGMLFREEHSSWTFDGFSIAFYFWSRYVALRDAARRRPTRQEPASQRSKSQMSRTIRLENSTQSSTRNLPGTGLRKKA